MTDIDREIDRWERESEIVAAYREAFREWVALAGGDKKTLVERVDWLLSRLERAIATGKAQAAARCAMELSNLHHQLNLNHDFIPERNRLVPLAITGDKIKRAAAEGHKDVHGDDAEKSERWGEYQNDINEVMRKNDALSFTEARRKVAKRHGVSFSTVKLHTHRPGDSTPPKQVKKKVKPQQTHFTGSRGRAVSAADTSFYTGNP